MKLNYSISSFLFLTFATSSVFGQYCAPNTSPPPLTTWGIVGVDFSDLSKTSTIGTYSDFTSDIATIALGSTNTFEITLAGSPQMNKVVWIDWDANETFDPAEMYILSDLSNFIDITTPSTAIIGTTRMRVATNQFGATTIDACLSPLYEVEDYTVNIVDGSNLGLNEEDQVTTPFQLYPNPAQSVVNTQWDETSIESELIIYNGIGQAVISIAKEDMNQQIDISMLSSGVYFVKPTAIQNAVPVKLVVK